MDWVALREAEAIPVLVAFPPVVPAGNGTYDTRPTTLTQPGCYSFGETMTTDLLTGGEEPSILNLGDPAEVVFVLPASALTGATGGAQIAVTGSDPGPLAGLAAAALLLGAAAIAASRAGLRTDR